MNLHETLPPLRRQNGLSQEELAARLEVSRQAVTKWEAGLACPELDKLLRMSEIFATTLDALVKGNGDCAVSPLTKKTGAEGVLSFLLRARRSAYAGGGAEEEGPCRPGAHDFRAEEADFMYLDSYFGGERFAGEETVWKGGAPAWAMNYAGRNRSKAFSVDFLREALLLASEERPFRGPALYSRGSYTYCCEAAGDFDWFQGRESIFFEGGLCYECVFHGGRL